MNSIGLGQLYKDKSSDASRWLRLFFGLSLLPQNEVSDAFTDDIMPDAPASDTAIKFADYVLENYIAADSKLRRPCGLSHLTCYFLIQTMALSLITAT